MANGADSPGGVGRAWAGGQGRRPGCGSPAARASAVGAGGSGPRPRTASPGLPVPAEGGVVAVTSVGGHHRPGAAAAPACSSTPQPPGPVISPIISRASRHFSACRTSLGIGRARGAAPHGPQQLGHPGAWSSRGLRADSARQSAAQEARSFTRCTLTPTGSCRSCPRCRSTAGPRTATSGKPVSSTTTAATSCRRAPRHVPPHRDVVPGRGRDGTAQPLMVHPQPLHRLALPVGQQPAAIQLTSCPLILTRQPAEHLRGELAANLS